MPLAAARERRFPLRPRPRSRAGRIGSPPPAAAPRRSDGGDGDEAGEDGCGAAAAAAPTAGGGEDAAVAAALAAASCCLHSSAAGPHAQSPKSGGATPVRTDHAAGAAPAPALATIAPPPPEPLRSADGGKTPAVRLTARCKGCPLRARVASCIA